MAVLAVDITFDFDVSGGDYGHRAYAHRACVAPQGGQVASFAIFFAAVVFAALARKMSNDAI